MHPHKPHHDRHAGTAQNKEYLHRISRQKIDPPAVTANVSAADLLDSAFLSYNAGFAWGAWLLLFALVLVFLGLLVGGLRLLDLKRGLPE